MRGNNNQGQLDRKNGRRNRVSFLCRLCRKPHPLKRCRRFLDMNTKDRKNVVHKYGYCVNCLAHSHSQGSCFTRTGCHYCNQKHHTMLHEHPRLRQSNGPSNFPSTTKSSPTTSAALPTKSSSTSNRNHPVGTTSLTSILKRNAVTLLPTALIKVECKERKHYARCLIDSASQMSWISEKYVDGLGLTTLELDNETICPITLWSCVDSSFKVESTLRVRNRISITTPNESFPQSIKKYFQNFILADKYFYKPSTVDIILGVDIYSRIIREGIFNRTGLPTAQNTEFGIILYGTVSI